MPSTAVSLALPSIRAVYGRLLAVAVYPRRLRPSTLVYGLSFLVYHAVYGRLLGVAVFDANQEGSGNECVHDSEHHDTHVTA